ncbi:MAG: hypothetical protein A3J87_03600 [Sideroxydans sp. RIFOXYB12_FULL_59_6]|nr:MAG: hypothetical protein A3J87_03600 [Sideroxydans sp. RIFOXYB12_FULL_59_6]
MIALLKLIHLSSVLIWVGGMFFAYVVLRPAAVETLEPPLRLRLWNAVFRRFFTWVWGAIATLLVTGTALIALYGGFTQVGAHVHIMLLLAMIMTGVFSYVYFVCYRQLAAHVTAERWKEAGVQLGKIRQLVGLNLSLGVLTVCVVVFGINGW